MFNVNFLSGIVIYYALPYLYRTLSLNMPCLDEKTKTIYKGNIWNIKF